MEPQLHSSNAVTYEVEGEVGRRKTKVASLLENTRYSIHHESDYWTDERCSQSRADFLPKRTFHGSRAEQLRGDQQHDFSPILPAVTERQLQSHHTGVSHPSLSSDCGALVGTVLHEAAERLPRWSCHCTQAAQSEAMGGQRTHQASRATIHNATIRYTVKVSTSPSSFSTSAAHSLRWPQIPLSWSVQPPRRLRR